MTRKIIACLKCKNISINNSRIKGVNKMFFLFWMIGVSKWLKRIFTFVLHLTVSQLDMLAIYYSTFYMLRVTSLLFNNLSVHGWTYKSLQFNPITKCWKEVSSSYGRSYFNAKSCFNSPPNLSQCRRDSSHVFFQTISRN